MGCWGLPSRWWGFVGMGVDGVRLFLWVVEQVLEGGVECSDDLEGGFH